MAGPTGGACPMTTGLEADGGDRHGGHGRRLPALVERREIGGNPGVGGRVATEGAGQSLQGSPVGKARVFREAGPRQFPGPAPETIHRAGFTDGRGCGFGCSCRFVYFP